MGKIGFIITSKGWGGLELNVLKLSKWLAEKGWEIVLFAIDDSKIRNEATKYPVQITIIKDHKKYFDFSGAYQLSKLLKKMSINQVMVFDNRDIDVVNIAKKLFLPKLKFIYQQHMQIGVNKKDLLHTIRFSGIDYWIAPLQVLKQEVIAKTRLKPEKIKVIPLCTETDKFTNAKYTRSEARQKMDINSSARLLGIMGRIDPKKGQLLAVQAVHKLQRQGLSAELLIVGDPTLNDEKCMEYYTALKHYIQENNLSDKVHIRGFTSDVPMVFNAIDIFVLASEGETYGMVTIEAMLSKLPIVATNSCGTPEILNYGEYGLLYAPNDLDSLCEKLSELIQHPDKSAAMAEKAQQKAMTEYSKTNEVEKIEKLLLT